MHMTRYEEGGPGMKYLNFATVVVIECLSIPVLQVSAVELNEPLIIDHTRTDITLLADTGIQNAKNNLVIAYGHTSHGSQIITGMEGLVDFKGDLYSFNGNGSDGALELRDRPFSGASDLGNPDRTSWAASTRTYLDAHHDVNVIIWSWCGQASSATETDIDTYLSLMSALEKDYPSVMFVYMTGHLDGGGLEGNLHRSNEQIRIYCRDNNKILYDFADIESYDPDGVWYGDKIPNDNCDYDTDGNGSRDGNWAVEWQNAHPGEWYECTAAHSQPLNANLKAYAAWTLWTELSECFCPTSIDDTLPQPFTLAQNVPNPFNASTFIRGSLGVQSHVELLIYNTTGQKVTTLVDEFMPAGTFSVYWNGKDTRGRTVTSGIYYCCMLCEGVRVESKKMLFLK